MELQNNNPFNHKGIQGLLFRSSTQFVKEGIFLNDCDLDL